MRALLAAAMLCAAASIARAEIASCYGREHGQTRTATGANYNPWGLTAAHRTLPFGTRVVVTNRRNVTDPKLAAGIPGVKLASH